MRRCAAVCCRVLQCVLQCVAGCCSVLQFDRFWLAQKVCCSVLQCVAVCCIVCCSMPQSVAVWHLATWVLRGLGLEGVLKRVAWIDMTHLHVCDDMCAMTHSSVCHDSFICVPWLIYMYAMTHSQMCHDSFTCVPRLIPMFAVTHSVARTNRRVARGVAAAVLSVGGWSCCSTARGAFLWYDCPPSGTCWTVAGGYPHRHWCVYIMSVCTCVCIYLYIYEYTCPCIYVYIYMCIYTCDCTRRLYTWRLYTCKCIWLYINVFGMYLAICQCIRVFGSL